MTLEELLSALRGQGDASGYLNDPNANPAVGRAQRYPSGIPMPNATLGQDGMRLPLPRIQGGAPAPRVVTNPQQRYPLVYGPSVGAENAAPPQIPPMTPPMRVSPSAPNLGQMTSAATPPDMEPWRQPEATMPMYQGGGLYYGQEQRLPTGAPAQRRGMEPPTAEAPGLMASNGRLMPGTQAPEPMDDDAAWNAARDRVRASMGRDPTGLRRLREQELGPLRDRARRSEMVASTAPRNWPRDISRGANFTRTQYGGRPIDLSRPRIDNADGSFSTERTITIEADGRHYNIPTIVGGRQRSEDEAIRLWEQGQNQEVGVFRSQSEAEAAARARSERIGQVRATR